MATRGQIIIEARTWLDTRFRHQGRAKGKGVDCLNLVIAVASDLNLTPRDFDWEAMPEYHGYGKSPNEPLLLSGCDRFMDRIEIADMLPGDIAIFRFVEEAQHFGIITQVDPLYVLHAYAQARKVTEHRVDEEWMTRIVAAYRFRNVKD